MSVTTQYKLGDIKHGREIGYQSNQLFMWSACAECKAERWVALRRGELASKLCRKCGSIVGGKKQRHKRETPFNIDITAHIYPDKGCKRANWWLGGQSACQSCPFEQCCNGGNGTIPLREQLKDWRAEVIRLHSRGLTVEQLGFLFTATRDTIRRILDGAILSR